MKWDQKWIGASYTDTEIKGFFAEYRWLSNFYASHIQYEGLDFGSAEAAFQAMKTLNQQDRKSFQKMSASTAKKVGRSNAILLRPDWDDVKLRIMYEINLDKYTRHPILRKKLLDTGNRHLEEANWWGDEFWGTFKGKGRNELGKILMRIREELNLK